MSKQFPRLDEFIKFVNERWTIHQRRSAGEPAPWTKDEVLRTYRFTNVRREDDRVTLWVHNWAAGYTGHEDLWFAFYVARVFNRPSTLEAIGWPTPWNTATKKRVYAAVKNIQAADQRVFNAAYIVSSHGRVTSSKAEYYMEIFYELWERRHIVRPRKGDTLDGFFTRLREQPGIGGFMGAQVVADVKHYLPLKKATDRATFAVSGPGSRRGLHWVCGTEPLPRYNETDWYLTVVLLHKLIQPKLDVELDMQNLQNCLCEFSKYCKVKFAGGRAKQLFRESGQPYTGL